MIVEEARLAETKTDLAERAVSLLLYEDGSIRIGTVDTGPNVVRNWGDSDYEFWTHLPQRALGRAAFFLLQRQLAGNEGATDWLAAFCRENEIEFEWESWA